VLLWMGSFQAAVQLSFCSANRNFLLESESAPIRARAI